MIHYRIEEKPAFQVVGKKRWIGAQDGNESFGDFWRQAHEDGLIDVLNRLADTKPGIVTGSRVFGVSRVERDPRIREFDFYIAAEAACAGGVPGLDVFTIPAAMWAIFENSGPLPGALVEAELFAFFEWLPTSGYAHAHAPELEGYPARQQGAVEFWLPIEQMEHEA